MQMLVNKLQDFEDINIDMHVGYDAGNVYEIK